MLDDDGDNVVAYMKYGVWSVEYEVWRWKHET